MDDQGNVYVADSQARLIKVYDLQGGGLFQFGGPGEADHHFGTIADLAVHVASGEIYVADAFSKGTTVKPKIKVFDLSGQLRRTLAADMAFGSTPLSFFGAMAFDPMGRGYFLDTLRNDIRILSLPSTYLSSYTPFGYLPGELSAPLDVAFDPETSRLFVLCSGARIEIFGIDGGQNPVRTNIRPSMPIPLSPELVVAILPGEFKKAALLAGGLKIQGGAEAAPLRVDFDSDGLDDLLVADGSGKLLLYKGVAGAEWALLAGVQLAGVTLPVGAVPFVADWNNDDRKDLLVGAADGSVSLSLNVGTQAAPLFAPALPLPAGHAPLNVGSNATPLLFDLNADGAKDLLVGSGNGALYKFLNSGSDEDPVLAAGEVLIAATAGAANASALVADWDADGSKEILLAADQEIVLYERQDDGSYAKGAQLQVHQSLYSTSKPRSYELQCSSFGQKIRLVAANTDGVSGKDLLIGNAAGEILLAYSTMHKGSAISPLFAAALLTTVAEIEAMMQAHALSSSQLTALLNQLKTNISSPGGNKLSDYDRARQTLVSLQGALPADADISALLGQLQGQLNSTIPLN